LTGDWELVADGLLPGFRLPPAEVFEDEAETG
jgi:hypothetical protein